MFDNDSGIEAHVKSFDLDERYNEHKAPQESPVYSGMTNECYIQAVSEERFALGIQLHPSFDFKGHTHARISCNIDGVLDARHYKQCSKKEGTVVSDVINEGSRLMKKKWVKGNFLFDAAKLDEVVDSAEHNEEQQLSRRGKITITIQRGNANWIRRKRAPKSESQNLKPGVPGDSNPRGGSTVIWTAATDEDAEEIVFIFFYTSRSFLETKKNIPTENVSPEVADLNLHDGAPIDTRHPPTQTEDPIENEATAQNDIEAASSTRETDFTEDCDDEERPPCKKTKTEHAENASTLPTLAQPSSTPTTTTNAATIQVESPAVQNNTPIVAQDVTDTNAPTSRAKPNKKEREKKRLMLELKEVRIEKRLMELDEEED